MFRSLSISNDMLFEVLLAADALRRPGIASTGTTLAVLIRILKQRGLQRVGAIVVHTLLNDETCTRLSRAGLDQLVRYGTSTNEVYFREAGQRDRGPVMRRHNKRFAARRALSVEHPDSGVHGSLRIHQ